MITGYIEDKIKNVNLDDTISLAELCVALSCETFKYINAKDYNTSRVLLIENLKYLNMIKEKDLMIYDTFNKFFQDEIKHYNEVFNNHSTFKVHEKEYKMRF